MKSPQSNKRAKALDVLDKHIIHKKKKQKNGLSELASSPAKTMTIPTHMPAVNKATDLKQTMNSPVPMRSGYSSKIFGIEAVRSPTCDSGSTSPMRKTVAFSDKLESSPPEIIMNSSPQHQSASKPAKSILKYPRLSPTKRTIGVAMSPSRLTRIRVSSDLLPLEEPLSSEIDPHNIDYWVCGEVHSLTDINNIAEFKRIIEGGLYLLKTDRAEFKYRYFEIYATFNNVIPLLSNVNNSEVNNRKINIIIENLNTIISVCTTQLEQVQDTLLKTLKKDPFVSRLYVQIVRFFNALLSSFKIVRSSEGKQKIQEAFNQVLKYSVDVLRHENSNKVMIAAQIALLREEKYGPLYLPSHQVEAVIVALENMKEINSTNLTCEKLLLLKSYLVKYPKLMLEYIGVWLPTEILSRLLIEEELYSMKIATTAISVLIDISKRSLEDPSCVHAIQHICLYKAGDIIPEKFLIRFNDENEKARFMQAQMSELLCQRVKFFIQGKKEYKLAMDFWLAMMGLLFNSDDGLRELNNAKGIKWLDVYKACLNLEDSTARSMALKSWRIVIFIVCSRMPASLQIMTESIDALLIPFHEIKPTNLNPQIADSIVYIMIRLFYITSIEVGPQSSSNFKCYFKHLIKPLFSEFIFQSDCMRIFELSQNILSKLVGEPNEKNKKSGRDSNKLKVLASTGVHLSDIMPISQATLNEIWDDLLQLTVESFECSIIKNINLTFPIVNSLILRSPHNLKTLSGLKRCSDLQVRLLKQVNEDIHFPFIQCITVVMKVFSNLFSSDIRLALNYLLEMLHILRGHEVDYTQLLKSVQESSKEVVSDLKICELFLANDDPPIKKYVANLVGSKLMSPKLHYNDFESLINIVNTVPTRDVIDNFLDLSTKISFQFNIFSRLNILSWSDEALVYFVRSYTQKHDGKLAPELYDLLENNLFIRENVFIELCPLLTAADYIDLVKNVLEKNPKLLDALVIDRDFPLFKILTTEMALLYLRNFNDHNPDIQVDLVRIVLADGNFEALWNSYNTIEKCLCKGEGMSIYNLHQSKIIINELLDECLERSMWELFNCTIRTCIHNEDMVHLINILTDNENVITEHLEPINLALMVNKCGKLNTTLIRAVKTFFKHKSPSYNFELIRCFIEKRKFQIFSICRDDFLHFIFDPELKFNDEEKSMAISVFERVSDHVVPQNKKLMAELMRALSVYLPAKDENYTYELLSFICLNPRFNLKGYRSLLKQINDWKKARIPNLEESKEDKISQQYHFYSLSHSRSASPTGFPVDSVDGNEPKRFCAQESHYFEEKNNTALPPSEEDPNTHISNLQTGTSKYMPGDCNAPTPTAKSSTVSKPNNSEKKQPNILSDSVADEDENDKVINTKHTETVVDESEISSIPAEKPVTTTKLDVKSGNNQSFNPDMEETSKISDQSPSNTSENNQFYIPIKPVNIKNGNNTLLTDTIEPHEISKDSMGVASNPDNVDTEEGDQKPTRSSYDVIISPKDSSKRKQHPAPDVRNLNNDKGNSSVPKSHKCHVTSDSDCNKIDINRNSETILGDNEIQNLPEDKAAEAEEIEAPSSKANEEKGQIHSPRERHSSETNNDIGRPLTEEIQSCTPHLNVHACQDTFQNEDCISSEGEEGHSPSRIDVIELPVELRTPIEPSITQDDDTSIVCSLDDPLDEISGSAEMDTENESGKTGKKRKASDSSNDCLRIPIFNSLKMAYSTKRSTSKNIQDERNKGGPVKRTLMKIDSKNGLEGVARSGRLDRARLDLAQEMSPQAILPNIVKQQAKHSDMMTNSNTRVPDVSAEISKGTFLQPQNLNQKEGSLKEETSQVFIERLRSFSDQDIRNLTEDQRSLMRIELLRFIMKLEQKPFSV